MNSCHREDVVRLVISTMGCNNNLHDMWCAADDDLEMAVHRVARSGWRNGSQSEQQHVFGERDVAQRALGKVSPRFRVRKATANNGTRGSPGPL